MTVKIRLTRTGKKKQATYRFIIADSRSPRDGRFIEQIGWYNPRAKEVDMKVDQDRALYWLKNGAQPTDSVASLLKRAGVLDAFAQAKTASAPAVSA